MRKSLILQGLYSYIGYMHFGQPAPGRGVTYLPHPLPLSRNNIIISIYI
jgi:hypothetical protein